MVDELVCAELALTSDEAGLGKGGLVIQPDNTSVKTKALESNAFFFIYEYLQYTAEPS
jgi:hypothetical protein